MTSRGKTSGKTYRQRIQNGMFSDMESDDETEVHNEQILDLESTDDMVENSQIPTSSLCRDRSDIFNVTSSTPIRPKAPIKRTIVDAKKKERKWNEDENLLFSNIIVDEGYVVPLEMLALKKSSNAKGFFMG